MTRKILASVLLFGLTLSIHPAQAAGKPTYRLSAWTGGGVQFCSGEENPETGQIEEECMDPIGRTEGDLRTYRLSVALAEISPCVEPQIDACLRIAGAA